MMKKESPPSPAKTFPAQNSVRGDADYFDLHLSPARRDALLLCLCKDGLRKRASKWGGDNGRGTIAGCTVFDLARDGLLTLNSGRDSARLTPEGLAVMAWHPIAAERVNRGGAGPVQIHYQAHPDSELPDAGHKG